MSKNTDDRKFMTDDMFGAMGWKRVPNVPNVPKDGTEGKTTERVMSDEDVIDFLFGGEHNLEDDSDYMCDVDCYIDLQGSVSGEVDAKLIYKKYSLKTERNGKKYRMTAKVSPDRVTLSPHDRGYSAFKFDRSTPDTVKAMALLMVTAAELVD